MSKTVSGTYSSASFVNLTLASENPVTILGSARVTPSAVVRAALYGNSGIGWTIANAGIVSGGTHSNGIDLGSSNNYVGASFITNQSGGTISGSYGIRVYNNVASSIVNQTGADIAAIKSTLASYSAVYMYGSGTVDNSGTISAPTTISNSRGIFLTNGGIVANYSAGTIAGGVGILLNGVSTVTNAGTIEAGSTVGTAVDFANSGANRLIVDPNAVFFGGVLGGGGTLELASGASAGTLTATNFTGFNTINFDAGSHWTLAGSSSALTGTIAGFTGNDTIDLLGFTATSASYAGGNLTLTNAASAHTTLHFSGGPFNTGTPHVTSSGSGTVLTLLCFLAGTRIATPLGEVQIETLSVGDPVSTYGGAAKPIVWIGKGRTLVTGGPRTAANPVIVRKNALADNVPNRDLYVTKGHSFYIDGVLIPAEFLVNHRSIEWDDRAREVYIYHIELADHDVLLANGAPAESYRDDGNRWLFHNANDGWGAPEKPPYAPVLTGGPAVDEIWHRLLARAGGKARVPTTADSDLHLVVDGVRLDAVVRQDRKLTFRLSAVPNSVRVVSRDGVPAELGRVRDPRALGVALRKAVLWQGGRVRLIEARDERLTDGFHGYEEADDMRWTNGDAALPIEAFAGFGKDALVELYLGGDTVYPLLWEDAA